MILSGKDNKFIDRTINSTDNTLMKIVLVYHELSFRGGERLFSTLAKGLIQKKHRVSFIVGRVNTNSRLFDKSVRIIKPNKIINALFSRNNILYLLFSMPMLFINLLVNTRNTDVIYSGESFLCLWPAILAAIINKKKLVLSVFELNDKPKFISGKLNILFFKLNLFLISKNVRYAITVNSSLINSLKRLYKIPYVFYILPGVDFSQFKLPKTKKIISRYKLQGKYILLMPGVLHPAKRQDVAIETLALVKKKFPATVLFIIGSGNSKYKQKLTKLVHRLNLQDSVIFTGFVIDSELSDYYAAADVVLQCGPIAGLTVIEGLYLNKFTVYPTSGNPPLGPVEPLKLGYTVKSNTSTTYAKKIIDYLSNPNDYMSKIQKDRYIILKQYSIKRFTQDTLDIFTGKNI